jgi:pimeloyl-ACP methyl ester carboxylesterase
MNTWTPPAGTPLAFDRMGDGPPLVLLHAFPFDRVVWATQRALADRFTLLLPDLPGFGHSPAPADGWTVDSAADLLADWLTGVGVIGPVALGGLSMGGYVALAFARRHPDRLRALILADTRAEPDSPQARAGRDKTAERARTAGVAAVVDDMMPKLLGRHTREHRPEIEAEVRRIGAMQSVAGVVGGLAALRDRPDARPGLATVRVPTLVLVGADDAVTPPDAARVLADRIPGARLEVLADAGHLANLEAPEPFTAAVRGFLCTVAG